MKHHSAICLATAILVFSCSTSRVLKTPTSEQFEARSSMLGNRHFQELWCISTIFVANEFAAI